MKYRGEVFHDGSDFLEIQGEHGYAPLVMIKGGAGRCAIELYLEPDEARELARHLTEAAHVSELPGD
jgi:hypothetical protein